nr:replication initiator [Lentzea flava]
MASKCPACADRNRRSRMAQCREGWHLDHEPVAEQEAPTSDQVELVTYRTDLTAEYRQAQREQDAAQVEDLREAIREADSDLRREGVRGNLPAHHPARPLRRTGLNPARGGASGDGGDLPPGVVAQPRRDPLQRRQVAGVGHARQGFRRP